MKINALFALAVANAVCRARAVFTVVKFYSHLPVPFITLPLAKTVKSCSVSKPLEFEGFKNWIIQLLPDTQKFNGISASHPILNDMICATLFFVTGNICNTNVVFSSLTKR